MKNLVGQKVDLAPWAYLWRKDRKIQDHPTANAESKEKSQQLAKESAEKIRTSKAPVQDRWFWKIVADLPKASSVAQVFLREDDIPNFLHFFLNHAIAMVGTNGKLWEHAHPDVFVTCDDPDNGTAAWFADNFRSMLLMEDDDTLWIMKGTPRTWLEDGKKIAVRDVPTWYGKLTYTVTSDVSNNRIHAVVDVPSRRTPPVLKLRLRHPKALNIQSVTINGIIMDCIDTDGETISLPMPAGKLDIIAYY